MRKGASVHLRRALAEIDLIQYLAANAPVPVARVLRDMALSQPDLEEHVTRIRMCGLPPYLPHDFADVWIEDGRVHAAFPPPLARPTRFTPEEIRAMEIAANEILAEEETPYARSVRDLLARLRGEGNGGPSPVRAIARRRGVGDRISLLHEAIVRHRVLSIGYYAARRDAMTARDVRPYGIAQEGDDWYLVAFCETAGTPRLFRIDRIRSVRPAGRTFPPPRDLDWRSLLRTGLYRPSPHDARVRVRLPARLAAWAREHLPPAALRPAPGGATLYTFPSASPDAVARWVAGLGDDVEVLSPPPFRRAVVSLCDRIAKANDFALESERARA